MIAFITILLAFEIGYSVGDAQFPRNNFVFGGFNDGVSSDFSNKPSTTPVPIVNFVDRHNPDGSYTYGYEGGDGSYKVETKHVNGEVEGKYGYYDSNGKLREVEYGASEDRGFQPKINGVFVAPPAAIPRKEVRQEIVSDSGRTIGVVKRRRPSAQRFNNAPIFPPSAPRSPPPPPPPPSRSPPRPSSGFVPFTSQALSALNPVVRLHPAQNINLNDGSFTVHYSGKK